MNVSVVAHNLMAMNGSRQLNINTKSKSKSAERLASGYRINRASDDAAGLAISEKIRFQVRGLDRGEQNTQDGVSFCQTADGAMNEVNDLLNRMQVLCVQAANDTNSQQERSSIQQEINQIKLEISRISDTTTFNDRPIFRDPDRVYRLPDHTVDDAISNDAAQGDTGVQGGFSFGDPLTITRTSKTTGSPVKTVLGVSTEGQDGYAGEIGRTYASAMFDFADAGSDYHVQDLIGKQICTYDPDTDQTYNIVFGNSVDTGGRGYIYKADGDTHTLTVNMQGQTDGNRAVTALFTALGNTPAFTDGHIQYARDNSGKLWIYDNRSANLDNSPLRWGKDSDFTTQTPVQPPIQDPTQKPAQDPTTSENDTSGGRGQIWIQAGSDGRSGMFIDQPEMSVEKLGLDEIDVELPGGALKGIDIVDRAREIVSSERSMIGAQQNRMEHMMNINANTSENLTHAESVIRDTDMAEEMVNFMKHNVLEQAGQSMLAQANQLPQQVLSLLQ